MAGNGGRGKQVAFDPDVGRRRAHERRVTSSARRAVDEARSQPVVGDIPSGSSGVDPRPFSQPVQAFSGPGAWGADRDPFDSDSSAETFPVEDDDEFEEEVRRDHMEDLYEPGDHMEDPSTHVPDISAHLPDPPVPRRAVDFTIYRGHQGRFAGPEASQVASSSTTSTSSRAKKRKGSASASEDWRVTSEMPGGPIDDKVIPSYGGHVARWLWDGIERVPPVLAVHTRPSQLRMLTIKLGEMSPDALQLIARSGLGGLPGLMFDHIDIPLITAFVERWQPDTNTFHLPFGEMTIMLHDVHQILGISVDGILPQSPDLSVASEGLAQFFGVTSFDVLRRDKVLIEGKISFDKLIQRCSSRHSPVTQSSSWLLGAIGVGLFTDKSRHCLRWHHFALLDEGIVPEVAWGAMTLAYLYRELGSASRYGCKGIAGCLTLLQAWIYEHFHCFRPTRTRSVVPTQPPRASAWDVPKVGRGHDRLLDYRRRLDSLQPDHVTWMPYGDSPATDCPRTAFTGLISCFGVIEPYMPGRTV